ncbi:unnamed protein product [Musa textilis]
MNPCFSLVHFCHNLETLVIDGCRDVSDESLSPACCHSLRSSRMDWHSNIRLILHMSLPITSTIVLLLQTSSSRDDERQRKPVIGNLLGRDHRTRGPGEVTDHTSFAYVSIGGRPDVCLNGFLTANV